MKVSRRGLLTGASVAGVAAASPSLAAQGIRPPDLEVGDLKAMSVVAPMGVQDQAVRLSWKLKSPDRDVAQARYEVQAASSEALLLSGRADLWSSGEVATDQNIDVAWRGRPLTSRQIVHWRVVIHDTRGRRAVSPVSTFEMGLLEPSDWSAKWIVAETALAKADREAGLLWMRAERPADKAKVFFRLAFDLETPGPISLFTVANNRPSELWLDGEPVDRGVIGPRRFGAEPVVVTTHDLPAGRHVVAMSVNDPSGFNAPKLHEVACAVLIRVERGDETRRITSRGMKTATATTAPEGWQAVAFDDAGWAATTVSRNQPQAFPGCGAFLMRRDFVAAKPIARARLYATALGGYEAEINGRRVGDGLLAPESTDFRLTALYRVHDVTGLIRQGPNAIGAMITDGWYGSYHSPAGRFTFGDPPLRMLAQLEITYTDGTTEKVATDDRWRITDDAPVVKAEIYYGEDYDARLEQAGWSSPGHEAPGWRHVEVGEAPPCALIGHICPPIRRILTLKPKTIAKVGDDDYVIDFGQNFSGWARLTATGDAGRTVTAQFAEVAQPSGDIDRSNLRSARCAFTYVFRGDPAGEAYEPHFTYFGFRYVKVSGLGRAVTPADIEGIVVSSNLPETGHLRIENPVITGLWQNTLWSQRSNFLGVPTDCPQRDERIGWTGDANVFWDAAAFNMDVAAFTQRWTRDVRDAQGPNGEYSDYAPSGWQDWTPGASPGWADAGVNLPWVAWKRYGDTAVVDQNWAAMTRYIGFIHERNPDLIWRNGRGFDFGDWVALDATQSDGQETTPKALIGTAFFKRSVDQLAEMAEASGRGAEAVRYRGLSADITRAYRAEFVRPDGTVGNGSHCGYILTLWFGLAPEALRPAVTERLVADIRRRGTLISTGFLGTPFSLDALASNDQQALVYDLLLRTEFPSWGYMVKQGATTIWERWNGDMMMSSGANSFNHYALGAVNGFVFRRIAGIDPVRPGFLSFRFDPVLDSRVLKGGGDYDSVQGRITTAWEQTDGGFTARIVVPTNARAEIRLPASSAEAVRETGRALAEAPGVTVRGMEGDRLVLEIGSGDYRFEARG